MQDRNILGLNALLAVSALAFVGMTGGCKNAASNVPDSKIVLAVESAGAGHLKDVSGDAIQSWLGQHSDVAKQISADCKTAYEKRDAKWQDTTEGRVCMADAQVLILMPHTVFIGHGGIHGTQSSKNK